MIIGEDREVRYDIFCKYCVNYTKFSTDEPCDECLASPAVPNSRQPLYFKDSSGKNRGIKELKKWDKNKKKKSLKKEADSDGKNS